MISIEHLVHSGSQVVSQLGRPVVTFLMDPFHMRYFVVMLCAVISISTVFGWVCKRWFSLLSLVPSLKMTFRKPHSLASYSLLHSDLSHLSGNLVGLYWFATKLQPVASQWEILVIFAVGVVMPAIIGVCIRTTSSDVGAIVGASCGVYALMGAHAALLAKGRLLVLPFATIRVEADFAWLILAGFIYMLIGSDKDVWHFGHICGGLVGFGLVYLGG